MTDQPAVEWRGRITTTEPPTHIRHVRDTSDGKLADRLDQPCEDHPDGNLWRWQHNGGTDCWYEIDGIGPWEGWR
jgi:hypothetical protein